MKRYCCDDLEKLRIVLHYMNSILYILMIIRRLLCSHVNRPIQLCVLYPIPCSRYSKYSLYSLFHYGGQNGKRNSLTIT